MTTDRYIILAFFLGVFITCLCGWFLYVKGFLCGRRVYILPPASEIAPMYYEKTLYDAASALGIAPPPTWDELNQHAKDYWINEISLVMTCIQHHRVMENL